MSFDAKYWLWRFLPRHTQRRVFVGRFHQRHDADESRAPDQQLAWLRRSLRRVGCVLAWCTCRCAFHRRGALSQPHQPYYRPGFPGTDDRGARNAECRSDGRPANHLVLGHRPVHRMRGGQKPSKSDYLRCSRVCDRTRCWLLFPSKASRYLFFGRSPKGDQQASRAGEGREFARAVHQVRCDLLDCALSQHDPRCSVRAFQETCDRGARRAEYRTHGR